MPDISDERLETKTAESNAVMHIKLSAKLYDRARLISEKRNCTLEEIIEDLVERFLPLPLVSDPTEKVYDKQGLLHDAMRALPWDRWTRRRPR